MQKETFDPSETRMPVIESALIAISPLVKEAVVVMRDGSPYAFICPDLEAASELGIIKLVHELHWYAVELYNLKAGEDAKIRGFSIYRDCNASELPVSDDLKGEGEGCSALLAFIETLTPHPLSPQMHLELDLELDSLDFVQLFAFVQERFGIQLDEKRLASMMHLDALCRFVETRRHAQIAPAAKGWRRILERHPPVDLLFSPLKMAFYKTLAYPFFKLYFRFDVSGTEYLPDTHCIIAPNHQSMIDGFLVAAALPYRHLFRTFFLAFELVWGRGFVRMLARNGQMVLINDNEALTASMQASASVLRRGCNLVIFPEGARSRDRRLLGFKRFFAILAREYGVPVVPVMIDGSYDALRAGMLIPRPRKITLRFMPPLQIGEESEEDFSRKVKASIASALPSE